MKNKSKFIKVAIIILIISGIYYYGFVFNNNKTDNLKASDKVEVYDFSNEENASIDSNKKAEEYKEGKLVVTSAGDILIHDTIFKSVKLNNGTYNFNPIFEDVKDIFESADISVVNLEVPVAGNIYEPSNYPNFNSPVELLDAIKNIGIDIVSTANNHALDKGYKGLKATIDNTLSKDMKLIGTSRVKEEQKPLIIEKNNIKVGFTAYTYGTNGIKIPDEYPFCINIINKDNMLKDIQYMKVQGVDFIIFIVHFGQEYELTPNADQEDIVNFLADNGVDVIFGSHPHVPQKCELIERNQKQTFVVYSHGNLIADQLDYYTKIGGISTVTLVKKGNEKKIEDYKITPTYTMVKRNTGVNSFKIIPLEKAINDYNSGVKKYTAQNIKDFNKYLTDAKKVFEIN